MINDPNDFEDITKETLDNVWYVQLLKEFYGDKENEKEGKEKLTARRSSALWDLVLRKTMK